MIFLRPVDSTCVTCVCAGERMQSWFSWGKKSYNIYASSRCCLLARRTPVSIPYVSRVTTAGSLCSSGGADAWEAVSVGPLADWPWLGSWSGSPQPGTLSLPGKRQGGLSWWGVAGQPWCEKCCRVLLPQLFSGSRRPGYRHGEFWCSGLSGVRYDKEQLPAALNAWVKAGLLHS